MTEKQHGANRAIAPATMAARTDPPKKRLVVIRYHHFPVLQRDISSVLKPFLHARRCIASLHPSSSWLDAAETQLPNRDMNQCFGVYPFCMDRLPNSNCRASS